MEIKNNKIVFNAKPSNNILKRVETELNGDKTKVEKFVQLFEDVFEPHIDKNTVVDIDIHKNAFVFTHQDFPNVKTRYKTQLNIRDTFVHTVLQACSAELVRAEHKFFQSVIAKNINSGKTFKQLKQYANKVIQNPKSKEFFMNKLGIAKLIKKENPNSKLTASEFLDMEFSLMEIAGFSL